MNACTFLLNLLLLFARRLFLPIFLHRAFHGCNSVGGAGGVFELKLETRGRQQLRLLACPLPGVHDDIAAWAQALRPPSPV